MIENNTVRIPCFADPSVDCPPECPSYQARLDKFVKMVGEMNQKNGTNLTLEEVLAQARAKTINDPGRRLAMAFFGQSLSKKCLKANEKSDDSGIAVVRVG